MDDLLRTLLETLELIGQDHGEVYDSDAREHMSEAIFHGFIQPKADFSLPDFLGIVASEGNQKVKAALAAYITAANELADTLGLSARQRLDAFQNEDVETSKEKQFYDDFFGHWYQSRLH